jgi:hypothetical protein
MAGATGLEPATFGVTGRTKSNGINDGCKFFWVKLPQGGEKLQLPADALDSSGPTPIPQSLAVCAYIDLGHAVGITGEAHFLACQFRHPG